MNFGLLGFACDEGVRRNHGRPGAFLGPNVFREVLSKINMPVFRDFGDIECLDSDLETAQKNLGLKIVEILSQNYMPVVVGGGHETAYGHFLGISKFLGQKNCGIINFDAHFDLRPLTSPLTPLHQVERGNNSRTAFSPSPLGGEGPGVRSLGTSGTPFLQIAHERQEKKLKFDYLVLGIQPFANSQALFNQARDLEVSYVLAENLDKQAPAAIDKILSQHEFIYLSICLDIFAEAFAPGVSAPQVLGVFPHQVLPLLRQIMQSNKVISCDIVELAPIYDRQNTTAKLAASLMATLSRDK